MRSVLIAMALAVFVLVCTAIGYAIGLMIGDPKAWATGGFSVGAFVAFLVGLEEVL